MNLRSVVYSTMYTSLCALTTLANVYLSTLPGIVAIHELGHFIGARAQGIRVKNFSIGMYMMMILIFSAAHDTNLTD